MAINSSEQKWQEYLAEELPRVSAILRQHNIELLADQPHIKGERFLMQALTTISGQKLILLGRHTVTEKRVVIKVTNDPAGIKELEHERACRELLHKIIFAYDAFHSPTEMVFTYHGPYLLAVFEYIEQDCAFLERPLKEQFTFALQAFKAQERARATTVSHYTQVAETFGSRASADYLTLFETFLSQLTNSQVPAATIEAMEQAKLQLQNGKERIEQYCGFLTHTDFVPHNFRIQGEKLFLLDFSSLRIGNKHESWARFLNFMTLYNRELEGWLLSYVEHNRSQEERESLQLMRLFRLGEIITYYANTMARSESELLTLNQSRVSFWTEVLSAEVQNTRVKDSSVTTYQIKRDQLRSLSEKERQLGLH